MISSELLVILLVACVVFGPNKLPMLAKHLGLWVKLSNRCREQLHEFWQHEIKKQQLLHHQQLADEVDAVYREREVPRDCS